MPATADAAGAVLDRGAGSRARCARRRRRARRARARDGVGPILGRGVIDAGVFPVRMPDALAKPAREVLARIGCSGREGRAV